VRTNTLLLSHVLAISLLGGGVATNTRANPTSVWTFAAALVLPAGYAAAVVAVIYTHIAVVGYRQRTLRPYRVIYDWAAVTVGVLVVEAARNGLGAAGLHGGLAAAAGAIAALGLYSLVSLLIVLVGVYLYIGATSWRDVLPRWGDIGFEAATLVLGLVAADLLLRLPWRCGHGRDFRCWRWARFCCIRPSS